MYDALARIGSKGRKTVPIQRHLSKAGAMRRFPEIKRNALVGAIEFYDARVDDARLVITLIRTAVKYGAAALNRPGGPLGAHGAHDRPHGGRRRGQADGSRADQARRQHPPQASAPARPAP